MNTLLERGFFGSTSAPDRIPTGMRLSGQFGNNDPDQRNVNPLWSFCVQTRIIDTAALELSTIHIATVRAGAERSMNSQHPTIGSLLRTLRARNNWTLKEMSERCGIPLSTLSKVEHDRLTLTYDKLLLLSQRLNMRMSELFAEPARDGDSAITARRSIGRIEDAIRVNTPNYDYFYLCPELRRKRMIPVLTRVRARNLAEFGELVRHPGEEYIHVLEGLVEVHTEFYDTVVLEAGQSVYIDSNMGHAYTTAEGCDEAVLLGICSSSDEQLMESLMTLHGDEAPIEHRNRRPAPAVETLRAKPIDKRVGSRSPRARPAAARKKKTS